MAEMHANSGVVTQITTVKLPPDNQDEVLALMTERAQFMAKQPGFVSICLYRSTDGSHVVNHVQWTDRRSSRPRTTRPSSARNGRTSAIWRRRSSPASTTWCTSRRRRWRGVVTAAIRRRQAERVPAMHVYARCRDDVDAAQRGMTLRYDQDVITPRAARPWPSTRNRRSSFP